MKYFKLIIGYIVFGIMVPFILLGFIFETIKGAFLSGRELSDDFFDWFTRWTGV